MSKNPSEEYLTKLRLYLIKLRKEKGISQLDFFIDTKIHIGRIESGKSNITINTLKKICDYYNVKISDVFLEVEKTI